MGEIKDRFLAKLDASLEGKNAFSGESPFVDFLTAQRDGYVQTKSDEWLNANPDKTGYDVQEYRQKLYEEFTDHPPAELIDSIKTQVKAVYEGKETDPAAAIGDAANNAIGGAFSSALTGGDFVGGLTHSIRHTAMGFLTGGSFFATLMTYVGSLLSSWFGDEKALSWAEAKEKVHLDRVKERMNGLQGVADVEKLHTMLDEAAHPAAAETTPAPQEQPASTLPESTKATAREAGEGAVIPNTPMEEPSLNEPVTSVTFFRGVPIVRTTTPG